MDEDKSPLMYTEDLPYSFVIFLHSKLSRGFIDAAVLNHGLLVHIKSYHLPNRVSVGRHSNRVGLWILRPKVGTGLRLRIYKGQVAAAFEA
jgi:hypothetical protein